MNGYKENGSTEMPTPAKLILEDGTVFHGYSFGAKRSSSGEAVFQTGMVGYPEALTDPSYRGQILCFTYPLIGNYGVPSEKEVDHNGIPLYFESYEIHTAGVVVSSFTEKHSHWKAESSFDSWLKRNNVSGIYDIDTRQLTQIIREKVISILFNMILF